MDDADHFKEGVASFISSHPGARSALLTSYSLAQACLAYDHNDLKQTFATLSYTPARCSIFNVGGNRFAIVVAIHYNRQSMFVRQA